MTGSFKRHTRARPAAWLALAASLVLGACATPPAPYNYTALKKANPRSILVLPPINQSVDVKAGPSVLSHATLPLAEGGFYVLPVALVMETLKANGVTQPEDAHGLALDKLKGIFGADSVLYITIESYGTQFQIIDSATIVKASARLVDASTGDLLWSGSASASSNEGRSNQGGLASLVISAILNQVLSTVTEQGHVVARTATSRLLTPRPGQGLLPGPRYPAEKQAN